MNENEKQKLDALRSNYLKAQREYVDAIKDAKKYSKIFDKLKAKGTESSLVWYSVLEIIEDTEDGKIKPQNMDEVEKEIAVDLTIIQNWAVRKLTEKSKIDDKDKER